MILECVNATLASDTWSVTILIPKSRTGQQWDQIRTSFRYLVTDDKKLERNTEVLQIEINSSMIGSWAQCLLKGGIKPRIHFTELYNTRP